MNNIYVIKCGGGFVEQKKYSLPFIKSIKKLIKQKNYIVLVHGGGIQVDNLAKKLNIPIKKINGRRITDFDTLQLTKMIYAGLINSDLVSSCIANGVSTIGVSGVSGKIAEVTKRPVSKNIDFGFVGDIKKINEKVLLLLLENGFMPIISCLGVNSSGEVFNINADSLATQLAIKLKAKKLIFITDVSGVAYDKDKKKFLQKVSIKKAQELISNGVIANGMIPKIENSHDALKNNVEKVQIIGGLNTKEKWEKAIINEGFGSTVTLGGNYE